MKLLRCVMFAQSNKLLVVELSPLHPCQPLTLQEAAKKILSKGKDCFLQSQEDKATSAPQASTHNLTLNKVLNIATDQRSSAETNPHLRITSTEGCILVFSPPQLFHIKNTRTNIF